MCTPLPPPEVPVLGDREYGVGLAVGRPVVEVGVASRGVEEDGSVDEALGCWRNYHLEMSPGGDGRSILVKDRLLAGHGLVPNTDVASLGSSHGVFRVRHRRDKD